MCAVLEQHGKQGAYRRQSMVTHCAMKCAVVRVVRATVNQLGSTAGGARSTVLQVSMDTVKVLRVAWSEMCVPGTYVCGCAGKQLVGGSMVGGIRETQEMLVSEIVHTHAHTQAHI